MVRLNFTLYNGGYIFLGRAEATRTSSGNDGLLQQYLARYFTGFGGVTTGLLLRLFLCTRWCCIGGPSLLGSCTSFIDAPVDAALEWGDLDSEHLCNTLVVAGLGCQFLNVIIYNGSQVECHTVLCPILHFRQIRLFRYVVCI